ncbi:MAG: hypothetical protein K2L26_05230 [Duncaniella sp.]|nr:hypothetical protein [Duncaniella sp.]
MKDFDDNISFVARHFRHGAFDTRRALTAVTGRRLGWTPLRAAASVAIAAVLAVTATVVMRNDILPSAPGPAAEQTATPKAMQVKVLDFDGATLPQVADKIRETYGTELEGMPEGADSLRLTLRYEGNARDLVEAINETLGTKLKVKTQE